MKQEKEIVMPQGDKPDFVVRAPDPTAPRNRPRWFSVGFGWEHTNQDGEVYHSLRLHTLPVGKDWDGALVVLPFTPRDNGDEAAK